METNKKLFIVVIVIALIIIIAITIYILFYRLSNLSPLSPPNVPTPGSLISLIPSTNNPNPVPTNPPLLPLNPSLLPIFRPLTLTNGDNIQIQDTNSGQYFSNIYIEETGGDILGLSSTPTTYTVIGDNNSFQLSSPNGVVVAINSVDSPEIVPQTTGTLFQLINFPTYTVLYTTEFAYLSIDSSIQFNPNLANAAKLNIAIV